MTRKNKEQTELMIHIRAWKDPEFKKELLANPKEALKKMGMNNIPKKLKVRVVEQQPNEWVLILRHPPENFENMTEEELKHLPAAQACNALCADIICTRTPSWCI